jgi:hypothetical protein
MLARTRFGQQAGERRGKSFSELKLPEYLALNPMGTSPAFQDGEIIIWEFGAVLTYLLERYDTEHKLHPACLSTESTAEQDIARTKFLHLQHYIISTVYPHLWRRFSYSHLQCLTNRMPITLNRPKKSELLWSSSEKVKVGLLSQATSIGGRLWRRNPLNNANSMGLLRLSISASFRTYAKSPVVCERLCKHAF